MDDHTIALVQYLSTLAVLATVTITLAVIHDSHAEAALAGLLGFAAVARPAARVPAPVAGALVLGFAGSVAMLGAGCSPSQIGTGIAITGAAVHVTCEAAVTGCRRLPPTDPKAIAFCRIAESFCGAVDGPGHDPAPAASSGGES